MALPEPSSISNAGHAAEKVLLKIQVSGDFAQWSEFTVTDPLLCCSFVLFFLDVKFQVLSGKIIICNIPVSFPHLHAVGQLVVHPLSRIVSHLKDKKLP